MYLRRDRIRRESLFSWCHYDVRGKHTSPKHAYAYVREGSINGFVLIMWRRQSEQHRQSCCGCFLGIFDTENSIQQKVENISHLGSLLCLWLIGWKKSFFFPAQLQDEETKVFYLILREWKRCKWRSFFHAKPQGEIEPQYLKWKYYTRVLYFNWDENRNNRQIWVLLKATHDSDITY